MSFTAGGVAVQPFARLLCSSGCPVEGFGAGVGGVCRRNCWEPREVCPRSQWGSEPLASSPRREDAQTGGAEVGGHGDPARSLPPVHPRMGNIDGCLKNLMDAWRTPQEATIRWKKEAGLLGGRFPCWM